MNCTNQQLVLMANVESLLVYTACFGHEQGPPRWIECSISRSSKHPAQRVTVVREDGESCHDLWQRTLTAIRLLKCRFGFEVRVYIWCSVKAPPANCVEADRQFNRYQARWHRATGHRTPMVQVRNLGRVARMLQRRSSCAPPALH